MGVKCQQHSGGTRQFGLRRSLTPVLFWTLTLGVHQESTYKLGKESAREGNRLGRGNRKNAKMPKLRQEDTDVGGRYGPVTKHQCPNCGALIKVTRRGQAMYYLSVFAAIAALFVAREAKLDLSLTVIVVFVATTVSYVYSLVLVSVEVAGNGNSRAQRSCSKLLG